MQPSVDDDNLLSVSIFHTNDMHGRLEAIARLAAFSRKVRDEAQAQGAETFFWDAGDAADRNTPICRATKGASFPRVLNAMGYTLQTMGNAIPFAYGPQAMTDIASRSAFPILAANCRDGGGPVMEGLSEFKVFSLPAGLSMGVIGLTSPWDGFYELFGLHFPDYTQVARRLVSSLRDAGVSVIIVLSHLGLPDDRRLAEEVDGIDAIIGGHTHDRLDSGAWSNGVLIAQTGHYAQAIGQVSLLLDPSSGKIVSKSAAVLGIPPDTPPDPAVLSAIDLAKQEEDDLFSQPVAEISAGLEIDYFRECGMGDMAADALRDQMHAEIGLIAAGQFAESIQPGTLTLGGLDSACLPTSKPIVSEVHGQQLLEALERGLDPDINRLEHRELQGSPMGIPQVSGLVVEHRHGAASRPSVQRVFVNGEPLDLESSYTVAHTDVEIVPQVGYFDLQDDQSFPVKGLTIIREVLADYLRAHSPVPEPTGGRWVLVGET